MPEKRMKKAKKCLSVKILDYMAIRVQVAAVAAKAECKKNVDLKKRYCKQ